MPDWAAAETVTVLLWLAGAVGCVGCVGALAMVPPLHPPIAHAKTINTPSCDVTRSHRLRRLALNSRSIGNKASANLPLGASALRELALNALVEIVSGVLVDPSLCGAGVPKVHVAPAGNPEQLRVNASANPFFGTTFSTTLPLEPPFTVSDEGEPAIVKSGGSGGGGGSGTRTVTVFVTLSFPPAPLTLNRYVPAATVLLAETCSSLVVCVLAGVKLAVMPSGSAELNDRSTLPANVPCGVIVTFPAPDPPAVRVIGLGVTSMSNEYVGVTFRKITPRDDSDPDVPLNCSQYPDAGIQSAT